MRAFQLVTGYSHVSKSLKYLVYYGLTEKSKRFSDLILQPTTSECEDSMISQIRIAYARGNKDFQDTGLNEIGGETLFGSAVLWFSDGNFTEYYHQLRSLVDRHYGEEFHNYTMIWRKDRIIFKVDGFTYGTITNKSVFNQLNLSEVRTKRC